jgi:hypothetical protein
MNTARRIAISVLMVVVPILTIAVWYVAWLDHADCLDALRQIGGFDDQLYRELQSRCLAAESRRDVIEIYGLGPALGAELLLWAALRRANRA